MKFFERFSGLLSVAVIALTIVLIAWLGIAGPVWRATWTAQPSDWLGLVGNMVSGGMTLVAAGLAYLAVKLQIKASREIAAEPDVRAMLALEVTLRPIIEALGIFWTLVDEVLAHNEGTEAEKVDRLNRVRRVQTNFPTVEDVSELESHIDGLNRDRAVHLKIVILRLETLLKQVDAVRKRGDRAFTPDIGVERSLMATDLRFVRLLIGIVRNAVYKLEPSWAEWFGPHAEILRELITFVDRVRMDADAIRRRR